MNEVGKIKPRILIVDDNLDVLDLLELFLYRDYEIITAVNGFDGLNIAKEFVPDCIVTDIMMPVMDGIKFINRLKRDSVTALIPVVAATSFVKSNTTNSLLSVGFKAVIEKPLKREDLFLAVRDAINKT